MGGEDGHWRGFSHLSGVVDLNGLIQLDRRVSAARPREHSLANVLLQKVVLLLLVVQLLLLQVLVVVGRWHGQTTGVASLQHRVSQRQRR
jgi:hypothetical protein